MAMDLSPSPPAREGYQVDIDYALCKLHAMTKRKSFGNPLSKALGKVLDEVAPQVVDGAMDVVTGPKKSKTSVSSSSTSSTDWHTRVPAPARKRH
jgi:hypothetical protein